MIIPTRLWTPLTGGGCRRWLAVVVTLIWSGALLRAQETPTTAKPNGRIDLTEVSLETLMDYKIQSVYAASRYEQKVSEAPSAVSIIGADEIKKYGHRSLAEVLQSIRGLYVSYDRNYNYLGMRGFNRPGDYNSRFLVLVDGHRVNENVFDSALIGLDFILDVDVIDRVEVIRGPSSSIYGNNAFFGVINIITRTGRALDGVEVSGSAGSFDTYKGRLSYGKRFKNDLELVLSGSYLTSDGPDRLYYPEYDTVGNRVNNGITRHTDYESFYKFFGALKYHEFTLEGAYGSRKKGIPTGSYGTIFNDDDAKTVDNRAFTDLKYERSFDHDLSLVARVSYDYYYYYGDYPVDYPPRVIYKDYARGSSWGAEAQVNKKFFDRHTLTLGSELRHNFEQDQGNKDDYIIPTNYDDHRDSVNYAFYSQAEILILTNLILNAGVRYDHFEVFGDTVNPRVGLIYNPLERTTLKLLYGTAFKGPNVYELYYAGPNNKGNTDLEPETIETYELVMEQGITKNLSFIASGFYYKIDDLINQQLDPADGLLVYRNVDKVSAIGTELELIARFPGGWQGRTSYTYQQTEDESTGRELSNSPHHLAKLNFIAPLYKDKVFSGLEVQYTSKARTLQGSSASGYAVVNWTLFTQRLFKGLEASVSIYNLFDKQYYFPAAGEHLQDKIEQDGRTFRVKLTYHF